MRAVSSEVYRRGLMGACRGKCRGYVGGVGRVKGECRVSGEGEGEV
jgi:hypothetical protein